jgi:tRNA 2-thiouridine synthesizing protein A
MATTAKADKVVDLKGMPCPMPVIKISQEILTVAVGQVVEAITTDPGSLADFPAWATSTGQEIVGTDQTSGEIRFYVKRLH